MDAGYVYVLVNSSMPGLVKVGKTRRLPSERVQELSSATGIATPFVVAFEERCDDCDAMELAIHAELEHRGFRLAQNREFFRASPNEVIRIIITISARYQTRISQDNSVLGFENKFSRPWDDLMVEADALRFGRGKTIQDDAEAIRVYKVAARMGSSEACSSLGAIYYQRNFRSGEYQEPLEWLKEATKRGSFDCYIGMAEIFCRQRHFENAKKSFQRFFDERSAWLERRAAWLVNLPERVQGVYNLEDYRENAYYILPDTDIIEDYLHLCLDYQLPIEFPQFIDEARQNILSRVVPRLTDQLAVSERDELTRVRDILIATTRDLCGSVGEAFRGHDSVERERSVGTVEVNGIETVKVCPAKKQDRGWLRLGRLMSLFRNLPR